MNETNFEPDFEAMGPRERRLMEERAKLSPEDREAEWRIWFSARMKAFFQDRGGP